MNSETIQPWRGSPFIVGHCYRVRHDFTSLRDTFVTGEVLTYQNAAYSRYDSYTGYFFTQPDKEQIRAWDISDDDDLEIWKDLFEELS